MFKKIFTISFTFASLLVQVEAFAVAGASTTSQIKSCFSAAPIYAVPACEQLIAANSLDHKIHFHLAKLYQKQNQLEKAKTTLEHALKLFDSVGDTKVVNKTARVKSDIDEAIWLQSQDRTIDEGAQHRMKCMKFSGVLPKMALPACEAYLAIDPGDADILVHLAKAREGFSKSRTVSKSKTSESKISTKASSSSSEIATAPKSKVSKRVASKSGKSTIKTIKSNSTKKPVVNDSVVAKTVKTPAAASGDSRNTQSAGLSQDISSENVADSMKDKIIIDPKVILDIKKELSGLYALLEEQKAKHAASLATMQPGVEYTELGKRYALVMGNADYDPAIGKLKNAVNDAVDISKKLKKLNFEVQLVTDSSLQNMEKSVAALAQKIRQDDTVLFYYAGHGVALEGENYLLPTKNGIKDAVDVRYKSLNLSYVLEKLDRGSSGVTMVVLDACRNNPFPVSRGAARKGLVPASGPVGTIIAYSTAPGDVAIDGSGRNGLYTKHLLVEMDKPNTKLEDVFKKVRVAVEGETQGSQVPWENSSLKGDFYFSFN